MKEMFSNVTNSVTDVSEWEIECEFCKKKSKRVNCDLCEEGRLKTKEWEDYLKSDEYALKCAVEEEIDNIKEERDYEIGNIYEKYEEIIYVRRRFLMKKGEYKCRN